MLPGMVTPVSPQLENALVPMLVTPLLMVRLVRLVQPWKAPPPMPVTLPAKTMTLFLLFFFAFGGLVGWVCWGGCWL